MNGEDPSISVIIPAYNASTTILKCLEALEGQSAAPETYEILVVDDDSTDRTGELVRTRAGVKLVRQPHGGPSAARNRGVQQARGEVVLFTDADCVPAPNWIECMLQPFADREVVGVKGTYLSEQKELVARFVQLEYEEKYAGMRRKPTIDFIDTYSAGYRRDVFLANGGFDLSFPTASVEDQEFSFRLAHQGYKLVFAPEAVVYHLGHARSIPAYFRKKIKIGFWKVAVHRRHPDKLIADSHTPQLLKVQMLLVALGTAAAFMACFDAAFWAAAGAMGGLFLLTTLPFMIKAWPKDLPVALIAPFMLFIRAAALGSGFAAGILSSVFQSTFVLLRRLSG